MSNWDTSTWIAVVALAISVLSFATSVWSAWVSDRTLTHTRKVYAQERRENFMRQRSELLEVINTSRSTLDRTRVEIGTLKAIFDAEPQPVRSLLSNYISLFSEYLPKIECGVRQASMLWEEVAEWDESTGTSALMHHEAKFRALLHENQMVYEHALYMINVFNEKLEQARSYVSEKNKLDI
jgi:hypothetical protein